MVIEVISEPEADSSTSLRSGSECQGQELASVETMVERSLLANWQRKNNRNCKEQADSSASLRNDNKRFFGRGGDEASAPSPKNSCLSRQPLPE
jgi:hypothetical protein